MLIATLFCVTCNAFIIRGINGNVKAIEVSVNQTNSADKVTLPRFVHYARHHPPNYRRSLPFPFSLCPAVNVTQRPAGHMHITMNRLTLRSRRVVLCVVCGVAVMLGAVGKSMFDQLSEPDINIDPGERDVMRSTALPPLHPVPQMLQVPQSSQSPAAVSIPGAVSSGSDVASASSTPGPTVVVGSVAAAASAPGTTIAHARKCNMNGHAIACGSSRAYGARRESQKELHERSGKKPARGTDTTGRDRNHEVSTHSKSHQAGHKRVTEDPRYGHHKDHH